MKNIFPKLSWRKLHNWIGLLVGLQVLAWIAGGVVMSVIPIEIVRGKHLITPAPEVDVAQAGAFRPDPAVFRNVAWVPRLNQPVMKLEDFSGAATWVDASTGEGLSPLSEQQASETAAQRYLGSGKVAGVELLTVIPAEASRLSPPMYAVQFDDWINTTFYVGPESGAVETVRSDIWRFYDFFWMLHIMDFEDRTDFNNPLLIAAAIIALFFTMTGFVLLYRTYFKPKKRKYQRHPSVESVPKP